MTITVYYIARYVRKATFSISDHVSSIFLCLWAKQFTISGSPLSPDDVPWKQGSVLLWVNLCQGAQGGVG